jgi:hypothetical protein
MIEDCSVAWWLQAGQLEVCIVLVVASCEAELGLNTAWQVQRQTTAPLLTQQMLCSYMFYVWAWSPLGQERSCFFKERKKRKSTTTLNKLTHYKYQIQIQRGRGVRDGCQSAYPKPYAPISESAMRPASRGTGGKWA